MGKPSLLWQVILAALNLLVFIGIIQVWWSDSGIPKQGPSQKTEITQLDLPRRDSQPKSTYQIVAAKNLFSVQRRSTVKTETEQPQKNDFDKNILQGIIVVGQGRVAIVTSKETQPTGKVEIIRPGETWHGYTGAGNWTGNGYFSVQGGFKNHDFSRAQSQSRDCKDEMMPGKSAKRLGPFLILILGLAGCGRSGSTVQTYEPSRPFPVNVTSPPPLQEKKLTEAEIAECAPPKALARESCLNQGYGEAIKNLPSYRHSPQKGEKVYPIELNLQNADLVEAVKVLSETLGLNYMIDPRVKGTVNVRASGRLTRRELISIMETLLMVNGATLVQEGQVIKIVPAKEAMSGALPVYRRGKLPEGTFAQVISLDQTSAKEMLNVLKPLVSQAGSISEGAGNSLVLIDYPANIEKLLELVRLVDSRALGKSTVRIVRVENASPPEIISELETIFSASGALGKKESFGVNFIPVDRMNSILILASSRVLMDRAVNWIRELDLKCDSLANTHVYHVENYKAKNLADILKQTYGEAVGGRGDKRD